MISQLSDSPFNTVGKVGVWGDPQPLWPICSSAWTPAKFFHISGWNFPCISSCLFLLSHAWAPQSRAWIHPLTPPLDIYTQG